MRPDDVGCSMSVLSYGEASRAFGFLISNNYIAVQVVVRNLNRDQQFILHDVEYAVNTDLSGRPGRFFSGRDKVLVRALASAEASFDPRNIYVHGAQAIGLMLSTLVPIFGGGVGDAAAAYNGGFYPGLDKVWRDMSTDQLNLLNDNGFSSTSTSQIVVPKASSSMFVTFIPSKQFEQGWWTQPCAASTAVGTISNKQIKALIPLNQGAPAATAAPSVDLDHAMQVCAYETFKNAVANASTGTNKSGGKGASRTATTTSKGGQSCQKEKNRIFRHRDEISCDQAVPTTLQDSEINELNLPKDMPPDPQSEACKTVAAMSVEDRKKPENQPAILACATAPPPLATLYAGVPKRLFKHWSGNSVAIFQELSTAVVAGMHIVDDKQLQPAITSLDCPRDATGKLTFPNPDTGSIVCPVKGKNLIKVKLLRLRNTAETAYAEGGLTPVSGDDTTASVSFTTATLRSLDQNDYDVEAVTSTGIEVSTGLAIHLDNLPVVTGVDAKQLDATKSIPQTITLTGTHLDKVRELHLYFPDAKTAIVLPVALDFNPANGRMQFSLDGSKLKATFTKDCTLKLSVILKAKGDEQPIDPTIPYTAPTTKPTP